MSQFFVLYSNPELRILDTKDSWAHFYLPSSRTILMGEQPNPWEQLHPQDMMSRHRFNIISSKRNIYGLYLYPDNSG